MPWPLPTKLAWQPPFRPGQRTWQHYSTKAEVHSLRARRSRGEGYVRSRIFDEIRLAKVRLAQREPAEAATVAMDALELAEDTRSSLVLDWLIRFDRSLRERYPDQGETASFHDELRQYVRKAAPLLKDRKEERATLTVLPEATPAERAYAKWGWHKVGQKRNPLPGGAVFDVMVRDQR